MLSFFKTKKFWVLFVLFFFPLALYLFLVTGTNNFAKLPVLTEKVKDISHLMAEDNEDLSLKGKISIICFLGDDLERSQTNALNLNQKIYKRFYQFDDFQFIVILPKGQETAAKELRKKVAFATDMKRWKFVFGTRSEIADIFNSFKTNYTIANNGYSEYAFIVDRDMSLRGRKAEEDMPNGLMYGYSAETVAPIHKKMLDDVKVLVAEYRMALKKNRKQRKDWLKQSEK